MSDAKVRVFAPATVANVACGFDIFGFALEFPGDEVEIFLSDERGVHILSIEGDSGRLSLDPAKNTAGVSVLKMLEHLGNPSGVHLRLRKNMPLGSGLGSSAASAAASVFGLNVLLGRPLETAALIPFVLEAERAACGSAHADNAAPCLLGGFTLIRGYDPLDVQSVPCKLDLYCTLLRPHIEINTGDARKLLPSQVPLTTHVSQTGNAAGLILALTQGDASLLAKCLQDLIAEPVRAPLIPGFPAIKAAAMESGALGCSISGSGPTLFALSTSQETAQKVGSAMEKASPQPCDLFISRLNKKGPRVLP